MKRAVLLHGTDGGSTVNWLPWMKRQLETRGHEVWVPDLPGSHTPNRRVYSDFLFGSGWDFTDNLVIGHSSGAVTVLNLLQDERCPKIATAVLVGAWAHMDGTDLDREQFKDLFPPEGFNFEKLKTKAGKFFFLHGSDDPFCPLLQARYLAERLNSDIVIVPGGHHLGARYTELPQLVVELEKRQLL